MTLTAKQRTVLAALTSFDGGTRTYRVAENLNWSTSRTYGHLRKLEALGFIERAPYSAINDIYWLVK